MGLLPDEARVLPPPNLFNRYSLLMGCLGYFSVLLHNTICRYPPMISGIHRQVLSTTIGIFVGYHMTKYENYRNAKRDRELFNYMKRRPELFTHAEPRKMAEVNEKFYPVR